MTLADWGAILLAGVLGAVFGSFANVVIWRFPRGESLSVPGSHCPKCDTPLAWYDNVPIVAWFVLRGRCRTCAEPISVRYPLVEAASAALWILAWVLYGTTIRTPFAIALFYLLLILAFIDLDTMRLPNALVALLAGVGVVGVTVSQIAGIPAVPLIDPAKGSALTPVTFALAGLAVGAGLSLGVSLVYMLVRRTAGLGMGDVKLLGVMGLFLGPYVLIALFMGSAIGAIFAIFSGAMRSGKRRIPFGPFLAMGGVLTAAMGPALWAWYMSLL